MFRSDKTIYVMDPEEDLNATPLHRHLLSVLMLASPYMPRMKGILNHSYAIRLYMPVYHRNEIVAMGQHMRPIVMEENADYPGLLPILEKFMSTQAILARYKRFGGIPGQVFSDPIAQVQLSKWQDDVIRSVDIQKVLRKTSLTGDFSDLLFKEVSEENVADENAFTSKGATLLNKFILDALATHRARLSLTELEIALKMADQYKQYEHPVDVMYQDYFAKVLERGISVQKFVNLQMKSGKLDLTAAQLHALNQAELEAAEAIDPVETIVMAEQTMNNTQREQRSYKVVKKASTGHAVQSVELKTHCIVRDEVLPKYHDMKPGVLYYPMNCNYSLADQAMRNDDGSVDLFLASKSREYHHYIVPSAYHKLLGDLEMTAAQASELLRFIVVPRPASSLQSVVHVADQLDAAGNVKWKAEDVQFKDVCVLQMPSDYTTGLHKSTKIGFGE